MTLTISSNTGYSASSPVFRRQVILLKWHSMQLDKCRHDTMHENSPAGHLICLTLNGAIIDRIVLRKGIHDAIESQDELDIPNFKGLIGRFLGPVQKLI